MSPISFVVLVFGGIVTGTIGALLGLGGGVFLIPFLVLVLDLPMHQAIATSIVAIIATSSAGAAMNVERRTVNIRLGMLLETATVAGAIVGGLTANFLSAEVLTRIFATLLLVVAVLMIRKSQMKERLGPVGTEGVLPGSFRDESTGTDVRYAVHRVPAVMAVSLVAGNISGLLGVGGGIFKVPAMHILSHIPMKAATATSNFMIGVTAAASAFLYFSHGHVTPSVAAPAALGVLAGSFLGIRLHRWIRPRWLNILFVFVLLAVAVQLYLR